MTRKGSYFFVIDAFIAGIIILGAVVMMFSDFNARPERTAAFYSAEDLFAVMEGTEIRNYGDTQVRDWINEGVINDSRRTILEQIVEFNQTDSADMQLRAIYLADSVLDGVPNTVGAEIAILGDGGEIILAKQNPRAAQNKDSYFVAKRIVVLKSKPPTYDTQPTLYAPVVVEVRTWQ
ncbi:hypothetical protein GOV11_02020 [Candidatus Woesearchaeota archaeon]|nr:hypothetical protein [Candidatus Woesearchaeota archaeon]